MDSKFRFKEDIEAYLESSDSTVASLAESSGISVSLLNLVLLKRYSPSFDILERFYSFTYNNGLRWNAAKSEIRQEQLSKNEVLLFHGSKTGINVIKSDGARNDCDFGHGFYCGENFSQASSFVCDFEKASVYLYKAKIDGLNVDKFTCDLDWMLTVCSFRGMLKEYQDSRLLKRLQTRVHQADIIIAPIADNKMFQVMKQFGEGDITSVQAMHALSASSLGNQYVFKSTKSIERLNFLERLFLCGPEKEEIVSKSKEREKLVETKLNLAKREFRKDGRFIDEILK
jgi:hypothetical protein